MVEFGDEVEEVDLQDIAVLEDFGHVVEVEVLQLHLGEQVGQVGEALVL